MSEHNESMRALIADLSDEADLCRNDGASDIADLLDRAIAALGYQSTAPASTAEPVASEPAGEAAAAESTRRLSKDQIDFILGDAFLAANGSVYSTCVYDFVRAIEDALAAPALPQAAAVPEDVMRALDRMCTPLHESHLRGATAEADARCMDIIRQHILNAAPAQTPPQPEPTMDDAIAAGDGTLHGAIDHWRERAERAEAALRELIEAGEDSLSGDEVAAMIRFGEAHETAREVLAAQQIEGGAP